MMSNCSMRELSMRTMGCIRPWSSAAIAGLDWKCPLKKAASMYTPRSMRGSANASTQCWYPSSQDDAGTASNPSTERDTQLMMCSRRSALESSPPHLMDKSPSTSATSSTAHDGQPGVTPNLRSPSSVKFLRRILKCRSSWSSASSAWSHSERRASPLTATTSSPSFTWACGCCWFHSCARPGSATSSTTSEGPRQPSARPRSRAPSSARGSQTSYSPLEASCAPKPTSALVGRFDGDHSARGSQTSYSPLDARKEPTLTLGSSEPTGVPTCVSTLGFWRSTCRPEGLTRNSPLTSA
mmetsp:Transcript_20152/g.60351  ORF Transcript_20152/g.60351 Transcript_20152/m.60351 type:complete len:297 (-) Transcript_20152:306-1196(-)